MEKQEKEPCGNKALIERKFSQERTRKLIELSNELTLISQTVDVADIQLLYQSVSNQIDELIIAEAKYQEKTMQEGTMQ